MAPTPELGALKEESDTMSAREGAPESLEAGAPSKGVEGAERRAPCRIVEAIRLPVNKYNTVRSFVESSSSPIYDYNHPYCWRNTVFFVKIGKWKLEYRAKRQLRQAGVDKYEEVNERLTLYDEENNYVLHYVPVDNELCFGDKCYNDMARCVVVPKRKLPFSRPIPCYEIAAKMEFYYGMVPR